MCPKRTVLIVDDEEDVLDSLSAALEKTGYLIKTANNIETAYELIIDDFVDLLITDIRMPRGTGLELLENLKNLPAPDRPIIVVVSGADEFKKKHIKEFNVKKFLAKPFDLNILSEFVTKELGKI